MHCPPPRTLEVLESVLAKRGLGLRREHVTSLITSLGARSPRAWSPSSTEPVVSKNTNELKTHAPGRFGIIARPATSYLSPSARCAPVNGLAGCYVSTIGKPHEYFDLTGFRRHVRSTRALPEWRRSDPYRGEPRPGRYDRWCPATELDDTRVAESVTGCRAGPLRVVSPQSLHSSTSRAPAFPIGAPYRARPRPVPKLGPFEIDRKSEPFDVYNDVGSPHPFAAKRPILAALNCGINGCFPHQVLVR